MPRYIDVDDLRDNVLNDNTYDNDIVNYYLEWIDDTPTADAVPVVHGEWIAKKHAGDMAIYGGCSECGCEYNQSYFDGKNFKMIRLRGFSFCPNCGADMRRESEVKE